MWNRQEVKQRAKVIMKRNYWKMFVVSLLATVLTGEGASVVNGVKDSVSDGMTPNVQGILLTIGSVLGIVGILYVIFIGNVVRVGKNSYYIKNHDENPALGEIFSAFKGNYINVVKIMFIMNIKIILWTLLFVIPGIVKELEYSMIPYILAEDPDISTSDAFARSKQMTTGQKMDLFVLGLSFIGWKILGAICCGVGTLFVNPYVDATYTEVYYDLKENNAF